MTRKVLIPGGWGAWRLSSYQGPCLQGGDRLSGGSVAPSSKALPWQATSSNSRLINYFGAAVEGGLMSKWP